MIIIGYTVAFILICLATYTDINKLEIPNRLSILPYIFGILLYILHLDFIGLGWAILSSLAVFIILLLLYIAKGVGAGDVKFLAGLPLLIGGQVIWGLLLYSFVIAGIIAIAILGFKYMMLFTAYILSKWDKRVWLQKEGIIVERLRLHRIISKTRAFKQIPFMIAVFPAYIVVVYSEVIL